MVMLAPGSYGLRGALAAILRLFMRDRNDGVDILFSVVQVYSVTSGCSFPEFFEENVTCTRYWTPEVSSASQSMHMT